MNNKNVKKKKQIAIPKSVQESIPYVAAYSNGVIESVTGRYTKSYLLGDCNFLISSEEDQESIFQVFEKVLNIFPSGVDFQINVFNKRVDEQLIEEDVMLKFNPSDGLDEYREELNGILRSKMSEGNNNLVKERYLTASLDANSIDEAITQFTRLDVEIAGAFRQISDIEVVPMTLEKRLSIFYDIYNSDANLSFQAKGIADGKISKAFDLQTIMKHHTTTKDLIAPDSMEFKSDYIKLGDTFVRVMYVNSYPSVLSTGFYSDINATTYNMLSSVTYEPLMQEKTMKMLSNQITNIDASIIEAQKRASRSGYSSGIISPRLAQAKEEAMQLHKDISSRDQKTFYVTVLFVLFAQSLEELNDQTSNIMTIGSKHMVGVKKLTYQQEAAFAQAIPLADTRVEVQRLLTTEQASLFLPFSSMELSSKNGLYYGLNAVTKSLIMYNRFNVNGNGLILGVPGSGKSFAAKREMLSVLLGTNDDVFVIDPEREYVPMAEMLGGEVVRIAVGGGNNINPLDMDLQYADQDNPVSLKTDYVITLVETILGGNYGLSAMQKSIIDRCVKNIYRPYLEYMRTQQALGYDSTLDVDKSPTLVDLYNELMSQQDPEAQNIALALELYAVGSLNTFAKKTNVDTSKRFVIYDIKDIGRGMKELGLQVCLNDVWNRTIANSKHGKRTWFYIDEFYLLVQTDTSAKFLQEIFKRARKWGGCPTGITQNVEDMLSRHESRTIISNSKFIMMLNQSSIDAADLASMFNINRSQMEYITNAPVGHGLLFAENVLIPFIDKYPTDTKTYRAMTTKPGERIFS